MYSVVTRLIQECDRVVKSTFESFVEERAMQRKVSCLKSNKQRALVDISLEALRYRGPDPAGTQHTVVCRVKTANSRRRGYR